MTLEASVSTAACWWPSTAGSCSTRIDYDNRRGPPGRRVPDRPWACDGGDLTVSELRIYRDIYYTSSLANTPRQGHALRSPVQLGPDEYFVLGDNSPVSNDSRFWTGSPVVPGSMLLGKPFLVHLPGRWCRSRSSGGRFAGFPIRGESVTFDRSCTRRVLRRSATDGAAGQQATIRAGPSGRPGEIEEREHATMGRSTATQPLEAASIRPSPPRSKPVPRKAIVTRSRRSSWPSSWRWSSGDSRPRPS